MSESASPLAYLRDPRLSAHAISAAPAWLWTAEAARILELGCDFMQADFKGPPVSPEEFITRYAS